MRLRLNPQYQGFFMRLLRYLTCAALLSIVACDSSDDSDVDLGDVPANLVGTWVATSLVVGDADLVDAGTMFEITFTANNNYQFITADAPEDLFCDGGTSCSDGGMFAVDGDIFIFDADEPDPADRTELTLTTLSESTVVLDGFIDTEAIHFEFARK